MTTPLYLRNKRTGEIHRVFKDGTGKFSKERCQLDQLLDAEEVTEVQYLDSGEKKCAHCQADEGGDETG